MIVIVRFFVLAALALLLPAAPAGAVLTVVDVETGKRSRVARAPQDGLTSVRWTADGSALIAVASERTGLAVRRYRLTGGRGRLLRRLPGAFDAVLNRDGTMVGALYDTGLRGTGGVIVRDVASGRALARLPQSAEGDELYESGLELAWSRDGSRVAYGADERRGRTVRIADARTGRVQRRLDARRISGLSLEAFSPTGDQLVYASGTAGRLSVLDVASGATRRLGATGIEVAWAPAGQRIATGSDDGVTVSGEDQRFGAMTPTDGAIVGLRWSPNGTALALVLYRHSPYRLALAVMAPDGAPRILVPYSARGVGGLQWSPVGRRLAYTS
jgi:Tol biopolymer transport system component